jgi:hypothetical protein
MGSFNNENDDEVALIDASSIEAACLEQALSGHRPSLVPHLLGDWLQ